MRQVHAQGQVRRDGGGRALNFVGTVLDITDRKQLQEQLLHSQKMDAVGQLAGGVAHDFNNPLRSSEKSEVGASLGVSFSRQSTTSSFELTGSDARFPSKVRQIDVIGLSYVLVCNQEVAGSIPVRSIPLYGRGGARQGANH